MLQSERLKNIKIIKTAEPAHLCYFPALSPIDLYPKLLQFEPCISESLSMSTFRPCIRPLVITRGADQQAMSTKFEDRDNMGVLRNYGQM